MIPDTRYAAVSILAFSLLAVSFFSGYGPLHFVLNKIQAVSPVPEASTAVVVPGSPSVTRFFNKGGGFSGHTGPAGHSPMPVFPIDLNTASVETLELLPGVGRKTAQRIIDKRLEKGGFRSIEELAEVRYIGIHKLEKIRPFVQVKSHKR